jgi:capsular polysaccharide biosynthesis protein
MELRHYLRILQRSWPLVAGLPLLVALLTLGVALAAAPRYVLTASILVTQRPIPTGGAPTILPNQDNWNSWAASEYIVDDILQLVRTRAFANDVAAWLQTQHGLQLDAGHIQRGIAAERKHRTVYLEVTADRADQARLIAEGAVAMLGQKGLAYWHRDESASLAVAPVDMPDRAAPVRGLFGLVFDVALRTLLALILAIGLAFLRHYLDQSLHDRSEVEALGLEVVGTIPRDRLSRGQTTREVSSASRQPGRGSRVVEER